MIKANKIIEKLEEFIRISRRDRNLESDDLPDWEDGYDQCLDALEEHIEEFKDGTER